jgi:hypothetical protein
MDEAKPTAGTEAQAAAKPKRERSPSFPFIALPAAIKRLVEFEEYFKRHPAPAKHSGKAWGMKGWTSQAQQTLAALKSFGLVDYQGAGENLQAALSEDGRIYLRAQQDSIKREVLKRAALKPKNIAKYFATWGADRPPSEVCLDQLVLKDSFNEAGAKLFLHVYDTTIAYAGLGDSDKVTPDMPDDGELEVGYGADRFDAPTVEVGDYVQWTSAGVDQFKPPRRVTGIKDDHVFVLGSLAGMPMQEITVVDAPTPKLAGDMAASPKALAATDGVAAPAKDISVLLTPSGRLQISADVDAKGLVTLKQMLEKYEEILKLLK